MKLLDELGQKKDIELKAIRLSQLSQVTGLPRETVRRKLENLRRQGKVARANDGRWFYLSTAVTEAEREFTRNTVRQFLMTAQTLLSILEMVDPQQLPSDTDHPGAR